MNKKDLDRAYSINRAINRLLYEKQRLLSGNFGRWVFQQKIHELENELETFPAHIQRKVKEMQDNRDFNRDRYEGANWTKKWTQYQAIIKTNFTDGQIIRFGTSIRQRQRNIAVAGVINYNGGF